MDKGNFYNTIYQLRASEELILYDNFIDINEDDKSIICQFLKKEYESESLSFPEPIPQFNEDAAFWAAKILYLSAQLVLNRQHHFEEYKHYFEDCPVATNHESSWLSIDLCLRFLPDLINHLRYVSMEDPLIPILESLLTKWHFSATYYPLRYDNLDFETIQNFKCLPALYIDRVIHNESTHLLNIPFVKVRVLAILGNYKQHFWKNIHIHLNDSN